MLGIIIKIISNKDSENYSQGKIQKLLLWITIAFLLKASEVIYMHYLEPTKTTITNPELHEIQEKVH